MAEQDHININPTGNPRGNRDTPVSELEVLIDGESNPTRLGAALAASAGTGTVTQVDTGSGLTGGAITTVGTISLEPSGAVPGDYTNPVISVDQFGRITSVENGSGLSDLANDPEETSGLIYGYKAGTILSRAGTPLSIVAGTVGPLPDDSTVNIYVNLESNLVEFNVGTALTGIVPMAEVGTESGAITGIGDRRSFLNSKARDFIATVGDGAFVSSAGFNHTFSAFYLNVPTGNTILVNSFTVIAVDDSINYIEVDSGGEPRINQNGFTSGSYPVAAVEFNGGVSEGIVDWRTFAFASGQSAFFGGFSWDIDATVGLDFGVKTGHYVSSAGGSVGVDAGTVTLPDDTVTRVFVDTTTDTFGFSLTSDTGGIPLFVVTTTDGAVTAVDDVRTPFTAISSDTTVITSIQFDKTNSTTLEDITGLSISVLTGATYTFEAILFTVSNIGTGVKAAIAGTATATSIIYEGTTYSAGVSLATVATRGAALGDAVGGVTAVTVARVDITGTITVNAAGTLTVQFAENAAIAATTSSVLSGSKFTVTKVVNPE